MRRQVVCRGKIIIHHPSAVVYRCGRSQFRRQRGNKA